MFFRIQRRIGEALVKLAILWGVEAVDAGLRGVRRLVPSHGADTNRLATCTESQLACELELN